METVKMVSFMRSNLIKTCRYTDGKGFPSILYIKYSLSHSRNLATMSHVKSS